MASKASEWANTFASRPQLKLPNEIKPGAASPIVGELEIVAEVTDKGRLNILGSVSSPERALALARWILDMFEESA